MSRPQGMIEATEHANKVGISIEEVIEKISLLLNDKKLSQNMGDAGRNFIEETYSWEVITKNFIRILNENIKK